MKLKSKASIKEAQKIKRILKNTCSGLWIFGFGFIILTFALLIGMEEGSNGTNTLGFLILWTSALPFQLFKLIRHKKKLESLIINETA